MSKLLWCMQIEGKSSALARTRGRGDKYRVLHPLVYMLSPAYEAGDQVHDALVYICGQQVYTARFFLQGTFGGTP